MSLEIAGLGPCDECETENELIRVDHGSWGKMNLCRTCIIDHAHNSLCDSCDREIRDWKREEYTR